MAKHHKHGRKARKQQSAQYYLDCAIEADDQAHVYYRQMRRTGETEARVNLLQSMHYLMLVELEYLETAIQQ